MIKNFFRLTSITCISLLSIGLFSCNEIKQDNNNDINNNGDNNQDNTGGNTDNNQDNTGGNTDNNKGDDDKGTTNPKTYTITTDKLTNFLSAEKETNGVYIKNNGVKDVVDDIEIEYACSIIGISSNKDYLNFFQFKKNTEDNIKVNTLLNVSSIVVYSSKNTTYDDQYGLLNIKVNTTSLTSKNNIVSTVDGITNFKTTYTVDENLSTLKGNISFSSDTSRAVYVSSIEINTK